MKNFFDILFIGIALSMDAFAVGICKGLTVKGKNCLKGCLIAGLWFGFFQALMPLIGYYLGSAFSSLIESFDHWIAFGLLVIIGGNMIRESFSEEESVGGGFGVKEMFPLAVATSIDALAVGVSFACLDYKIWEAILIIGLTTFVLSFLAVKIGSLFGARYRNRATLAGGVILVLIGIKILFEHLGVLSF